MSNIQQTVNRQQGCNRVDSDGGGTIDKVELSTFAVELQEKMGVQIDAEKAMSTCPLSFVKEWCAQQSSGNNSYRLVAIMFFNCDIHIYCISADYRIFKEKLVIRFQGGAWCRVRGT